jgi:hypothetical protein
MILKYNETTSSVHRLTSAFHRPSSPGRLSPMAFGSPIGVIYIMIANQMKSYPATHRDASLFARLQWFMAVIGIVTAIACSMVLVSEIEQSQEEVKQSRLLDNPGSHIVRQLSSVKAFPVFLMPEEL